MEELSERGAAALEDVVGLFCETAEEERLLRNVAELIYNEGFLLGRELELKRSLEALKS